MNNTNRRNKFKNLHPFFTPAYYYNNDVFELIHDYIENNKRGIYQVNLNFNDTIYNIFINLSQLL